MQKLYRLRSILKKREVTILEGFSFLQEVFVFVNIMDRFNLKNISLNFNMIIIDVPSIPLLYMSDI